MGPISKSAPSEDSPGTSPSTSKSKTSIEDSAQIGGNFDPSLFVDKIVDVVTKRLVQFSPSTTYWKYYDRAQPTLVSNETSTNSTQPINFNVPLKQNDLNDDTDELRVINALPKQFRHRASQLLQILDARSNEITYDLQLCVYIDGISIPGSNIVKYLTRLFSPHKFRVPLEGFEDFVTKLNSMGLSHFYSSSSVRRSRSKQKVPNSHSTSSAPAHDTDEWWLLV